MNEGPVGVDPQRSGVVPALAVRSLEVRYGRTPVLEDVAFHAPKGCSTVLVGPSGSGKTTLLWALARLTDLVPSSRVRGEARLLGMDLLAPDLDLRTLRRRVGFVFQEPNPFPFSIRENLELPLREHGVRRAGERAERAERALAEVGLLDEVKDRLDRPATSLSGGQQQRLCLARALVLEPEVLLLDEPTSALDALSGAAVEGALSAQRGRRTVLLVTHDLRQAERLADHVVCLWKEARTGRVVEESDAATFFAGPRHPLARALWAAARRS